MFVCEQCHETDRDATECLDTVSEHRSQLGLLDSYGPCDICGERANLLHCWMYEDSMMRWGMHSEEQLCTNCAFIFNCERIEKPGHDPEAAKECATFLFAEGYDGNSQKGIAKGD